MIIQEGDFAILSNLNVQNNFMENICLTCVLMRISSDFTQYHLENFKNNYFKKEEFWNIWRIYNIKHKTTLLYRKVGC